MAQDRDLTNMTPDQLEDFYQRWKEWILAIARRDGLMVMHTRWAPFFSDLLQRLGEDPWWTLAVPAEVVPMMRFDKNVPEMHAFIWTAVGKIQTPGEFFGPTGFGRIDIGLPSSEGVMPWKAPKDAKIITPDKPGEYMA